MPTARDIVLGVVVPFAAAAALAAVGRKGANVLGGGRDARPTVDLDARPTGPWAESWVSFWVASAVAVGFVAGHVGLRGWRWGWPHGATDWLVYLAAGGWAVSLLALSLRRSVWMTGLFGLAVCVSGSWALLESFAPDRWFGEAAEAVDEFSFDFGDAGRWEAGRFLGVITVMGFAGALMWGWVSGRDSSGQLSPRGWARPWGLLVVAIGCAGVNLLTGSMALGMLGGALAAAVGGAIIGAWGAGWRAFDGAGCVAATVIGGLLVVGHYYSSLPGLWAWVVFGALIPGVGLAGRIWRSGGWWAGAGDLLLTVLLVGSVVGLAVLKFVEDVRVDG